MCTRKRILRACSLAIYIICANFVHTRECGHSTQVGVESAPDGVRDAINVFIFCDLSPSAGSEAALLTRQWDAVLSDNATTSFSDTGYLLVYQKPALVVSWDDASKKLEYWEVFFTILIHEPAYHPTTQEIYFLIEVKEESSVCLRAQAQQYIGIHSRICL